MNKIRREHFGKLPPQAIDLEEYVLGALLIEPNAINLIVDTLTPASFYKPQNEAIFQACLNLYKDSIGIDVLMVANNLKQSKKLEAVGGIYYISSLTNKVGSTVNIEHHSAIIQQKYIGRELIRISEITSNSAYQDDTDILDLLEQTQVLLMALSKSTMKQQAKHLSVIVEESRKKINMLSISKNEIVGIPSLITKLDLLTKGFEEGGKTCLAARPGMGKSAFAVSLIKNIGITQKIPCGFFSIEMPNIQQEQRLKANVSGIKYSTLRTGRLQQEEWELLDKAEAIMKESPVYIDDTATLNITDLRAKVHILVVEFGIKILFIDYVQLMSGTKKAGQNREQEISEISRTTKALAKEYKIHIIELAQLSRNVENRPNKVPMLSDLRESGALEQDADIVIFINRPEYYGIMNDDEGNSTVGMADLIVAKNRNGGTGTVGVRFIADFMSFEDVITSHSNNTPVINKSFMPKGVESDFNDF